MPPTPAPPPSDDAALEQMLRDSRGLEDAPEALILRTIGTLQTLQQQRRANAPGLLQRVLAALVFDSAQAPALALGIRAGAAVARQLVFSAPGVDVDLRIAAADDGALRLSGQVLGVDGPAQVRVFAAGAPVHEQPLDGQGQFRLPPLTAARCTIHLVLAGSAVELPPIELVPPQ